MSNAAAAIAHELGIHVDDLVDDHDGDVETPDGQPGGTIEDTLPTTSYCSFLVIMADGTRVLVVCTEVPSGN